MTDAAKIARGLTGIQAMAVLLEGWADDRAPFSANVMRALVAKGLFTRCDRQGFRPTYETTPLGLAVRAELERNSYE